MNFSDLQKLVTTPRNDHPARKHSRQSGEVNVQNGKYFPNPPDCTGIRNIINKEGIVIGIRYN